MNCEKYADLIPLVALGEATDSERAAFEQHAANCADCRAELERLHEVVTLLQPRPGEAPAEIETLQMENEILRRLAEESLHHTVIHRRRAPLRLLVRIAAAVVFVTLGYLARPSLSGLFSTPQPTAHVPEPIVVREDVRRAMKSGYRFSNEGLAVIARGAEAVKEIRDAQAGR